MISSAIWNLRSVPVVEFFFRSYNKHTAEKIYYYDMHEKAVQASIKANLVLYEYLLKNTKAEDLEWMSETLKPLKASLIADGVDLNEAEKTITKGNEDMASVTTAIATGVAATGAGAMLYAAADAVGAVDGAKDIAKKVANQALFDRGPSSRHSQQLADNDAMSARRARKQVLQDAAEHGIDVPERLRNDSPEHKERWIIGGYNKETRKKLQQLANDRLADVETVTFRLEAKKNKQIWEVDNLLAQEEAETEAEIATAKAAALAVETAAKAKLAKKKHREI